MPGIDYSKWDKLNYSSSSATDSDVGSGDDEEEQRLSGPQLTRLEYPSRVTLGPNGVQLQQAPPRASASPFASALTQGATSSSCHQATPLRTAPSLHSAPARDGAEGTTSASCPPSAAVTTASLHGELHTSGAAGTNEEEDEDDEEDLLYESLARNGGREGAEQWWAQTEDTVMVTFVVPWETTSKSVTEFRVYEAPEGTASGLGNGVPRAQLTCTIHPPPPPPPQASTVAVTTTAPFHVSRMFRYPVKLKDDLLEGCWQLHRMPRRHLRLLVVQLFKEPIGLGMTLWWDRCFTTDTLSVIHDTQSIPDRVRRREATPGSQEKAEQFRKVWAEAHEEFRRRVQERKRNGRGRTPLE